MKATLPFISLFFGLWLSASLNAQDSWADYIQEDRGDTVVVKPTSTTGKLNTMFHAIMGDTTATGERTNPNRVYETMRGEVYIYDSPARIDATVPELKIVAPAGTDVPPLHFKTNNPEGKLKSGFFDITGGDFYMENQYICMATTSDVPDRKFFGRIGDNGSYVFNNCVLELTNWTFLSNWALNSTFKISNCLILNVGREANLEKGCFVDGAAPIDTMWMENNTILNSGTFMVTRPNAGPSFIYFNHNTFVNATNNPFSFYSQAEQIVTNNLFINSGLVPNYPGFYPFHEDEDMLPKGIINVDTVEAAWIADHWQDEYPVASDADRKILVDKNNAWWDSRFMDMFNNDLAPFPDTISESWAHQMFTMNSRTQAMFDDDDAYPYLVEGTWYNKETDFVTLKDMVPEWVSFIVSNAKPGDPNGGDPQPIWKTNDITNLVDIDWPILADLSYADADLKGGAVNGYPLGDLNWFPGLKASWMETGESLKLIASLKAGELPTDWDGVSIESKDFQSLNTGIQTFPNPFAEQTTVRFDLPRDSNIELIIYNLIGEKVRLVQLGHRSSGLQEVTIHKGGLNTGIYLLQVNTDYNNAGLITKITIQ